MTSNIPKILSAKDTSINIFFFHKKYFYVLCLNLHGVRSIAND